MVGRFNTFCDRLLVAEPGIQTRDSKDISYANAKKSPSNIFLPEELDLTGILGHFSRRQKRNLSLDLQALEMLIEDC